MKKGLYVKLAWNGIVKNKKLYIPYLVTGIAMVMLFYIMTALIDCPAIATLPEPSSVKIVLSSGCIVLGLFSILFLLYTNSFLIRQREKEFGLYNILGMGKKNIVYVVFIENIYVMMITLGIGLFSGVIFSKLAELGLINVIHQEVDYALFVSKTGVLQTIITFVTVFFVVLFRNIFKILRNDPLTLFKSPKLGEKPPKANWFIALLGIIILSIAYVNAVKIKTPAGAISQFLGSVILVIIATYMLFIAGSVTLCKLLQKSRKYYYKQNHFISVSSMVYRMKRNGQGLASICILCTMVLVMMGASVALYVGSEESIRSKYPKDFYLELRVPSLDLMNNDTVNDFKEDVKTYFAQNEVSQKEFMEVWSTSVFGCMIDGKIMLDSQKYDRINTEMLNHLYSLSFVSLDTYNELTNQDIVLAEDEVIVLCDKQKYKEELLNIEFLETKKVVQSLVGTVEKGNGSFSICPTLTIVANDLPSYINPLMDFRDTDGDIWMQICYSYSFDTDLSNEEEIILYSGLQEIVRDYRDNHPDMINYVVISSLARERSDFYVVYGGLLFLGIILSIAFVLAMILIIYYKQVSEGYEDQERFEIMHKVGMTKREIKKSINSQILTVFFAPLVVAGIHLCFAFPFMWMTLQMFGLTNLSLLIITSIIFFVIFGCFYAGIYKVTSNVYFDIVSKDRM